MTKILKLVGVFIACLSFVVHGFVPSVQRRGNNHLHLFELHGTVADSETTPCQGVRVTELDAASLLVAWPAAPGVASYKVNYKNQASGAGSFVTVCTPEVRLAGLSPGVQYEVTVSAAEGAAMEPRALFLGTRAEYAAATPTSSPPPPPGGAAATAAAAALGRLELRVGRIVSAAPHPDADALFVEEVDLGEPEPRTIVSGLRKYQTVESLTGRMVVVLCNLKPRAMRGIMSPGMLMCASDENKTKVEPITPPEGSTIGELITFEGYQVNPLKPGLRANRAYEEVAGGFAVRPEDGVAAWEGVPLATRAGPVTSQLIGRIS